MSDPGTWAHLPSGRHTSPARTADGIAHSRRHWARAGLGYWTARLRADADVPGLRPGQVVGTGGPAAREGPPWPKLHYRFTPPARAAGRPPSCGPQAAGRRPAAAPATPAGPPGRGDRAGRGAPPARRSVGDPRGQACSTAHPGRSGRGLAGGPVAAALGAAHAVAPDRPVVGCLLEHNAESRGRAERAGLSL